MSGGMTPSCPGRGDPACVDTFTLINKYVPFGAGGVRPRTRTYEMEYRHIEQFRTFMEDTYRTSLRIEYHQSTHDIILYYTIVYHIIL